MTDANQHTFKIDRDAEDITSSCVGKRVDTALTLLLPDISRTQLRNLIEKELVLLNGTPCTKPSHKLVNADTLALTIPAPVPTHISGEEIPLDIVHEDDDVIVINKPVGLVVHPGAGNRSGTLVNALIHHCGESLSGIGGVERPGIVHRLDKDTSGLMVVAKNDYAHQHLTKQFAKRTLGRTYLALLWGVPKPLTNTINAPITRARHNRQKMTIARKDGKEAITDYVVKDIYANEVASLVECTLHSGRTHQIRVHMASIGHGVVGDTTYGRLPRFPTTGLRNSITQHVSRNSHQHLHAYKLKFIHPTTKEDVEFTVETPDLFAQFLQIVK